METMGTRVQESKSNKTESAKNGYKMLQKSFRIYLGFRMLIFSFFSKNRYAISETMLSKALPMPNSKAIPVRVGVQMLVI